MKTIKINFDSQKNELLGISDYLAVHFFYHGIFKMKIHRTESRKEIYERKNIETKQIFTALRSNGSDHHDPTEHKSDHGRRSRKCLYDRFTGGKGETIVWTAEY